MYIVLYVYGNPSANVLHDVHVYGHAIWLQISNKLGRHTYIWLHWVWHEMGGMPIYWVTKIAPLKLCLSNFIKIAQPGVQSTNPS